MGLLVRLKEEIVKKRLQIKKKEVLFHQDNVPCHKLITTMAKLHELHFELLSHSPYFPDLAPSDYYPFRRPINYALRKEIWLQLRSDCRN